MVNPVSAGIFRICIPTSREMKICALKTRARVKTAVEARSSLGFVHLCQSCMPHPVGPLTAKQKRNPQAQTKIYRQTFRFDTQTNMITVPCSHRTIGMYVCMYQNTQHPSAPSIIHDGRYLHDTEPNFSFNETVQILLTIHIHQFLISKYPHQSKQPSQ